MNDHPFTFTSDPSGWGPLRIVGLYLLAGTLWIIFSDQLAAAVTGAPAPLLTLNILKGLGYIVLTSLLLYWLIRRYTAALSESEQRYRSLFQNNHSIMLVIDSATGDIVDANPAACAFYGYTHTQITSLKISDINQLTPAQVLVEMERAKQEQRYLFFFPHRLASGEVRQVEVYSGPVKFKGRSLLYSIVHDITERQQAEEALRESEEKYRTLLESMADGVFVAQDYHFVFANAAAPAMLKYTPEAFIGLPFEAVIAPEFLPLWTERFTQRTTQEVEPPKHYEVRMLCNGGEASLWIDLRASRIRYQGRPAVMGIIRDITERKQLEERLQRSQRTFKLFVEYAPAAIAMFDRNMVYLAASRRFQADYRLKEQNLVGRSHYEVFPEIPEHWKDIHRRCLAGAIEKCAEDPFPRQDGTLDWIRWEIHPWYEQDDKIGGIILFSEVITERKQALEALRESEERLRLALMAANQGLYDLNVQTGEAQVSPEYASMLGYDPATFHETNARWLERLHPDDHQRVGTIYRAYIQGQLPVYAVEFRQRTQWGDWKWILSLGKIVAWDSQGRPLRMLGTHTDITERKQAEAALRQSEERFAKAFQSSPAALILIRLADNCIIDVNESYTHLFGYSHAELINRRTTELNLLPPAERAELMQRLQQQGSLRNYETAFQTKSGQLRQVLLSAEAIDLNSEEHLLALILDITDRKLAEARLRESEEWLRLAHEAADLGIWRHDVAANTFYLDARAQAQYGFDTAAVSFGHMLKIVHPADLARLQQATAAALDPAGEGRNAIEYRIILPNGAVRWLASHARVIFEGEGPSRRPTLAYGTSQDITARKQAEADLHRMMAELSRSNADLEQFAYVASHDLQEPLRAVAGMLQLLQQRYQGRLDARADEYIRHAVEGASRMQTLINDLLAFSRVGRRGQEFQPTNCAEVLAVVQANLAVALAESQASLTLDPLPTVMADRTQLIQLFQNLIANAVKFRGAEPPAIHLSVTPKEGEYLVSVRDNGIGMEAQYFERIFGVFQRLHTRQEYPGTGIGLALCKKIVERHGGRIWVESEPGRGSTFYFTLPRTDDYTELTDYGIK